MGTMCTRNQRRARTKSSPEQKVNGKAGGRDGPPTSDQIDPTTICRKCRTRETQFAGRRHFAFGPDPDSCCEFKKVWRAGEVSTLASHGITPVEHDDDSEHRPGINDLRYVIQNNSDALSAGVPKFFMSVARQYRHQA